MNQSKNKMFPKMLSDLNRRYYLFFIIIFPSLFLLIFFSFSSSSSSSSFVTISPLKTFFTIPYHYKLPPITPLDSNKTELNRIKKQKLDELNRSKIAICLVGGARRFELTGSSIVKNVLNVYPNSDLFLHSPLDKDSFKFSLLKNLPRKTRIVSIRIFKPKPLLETESQIRVLTSANSPNGIQGLLQYFNLVEGCLTMIKRHQTRNNFTYDWVVRTRVDGYWNAPLDPENFIPGYYLIPPGSNFGGLNDRLGIGDMNASSVALSRLSLIPELDSYGFTGLNSEAAFRAQLRTQGVKYHANRLPFCILSDRKYSFPPTYTGVPVASLSSPGPLSGTKCRPCKPVCVGSCVGNVMRTLYKWHGWTNWENGAIELCDAHDEWETGWEKIFDQVAGSKFACVRRHIKSLELTECIKDFDELRRRTDIWNSPSATEICRLGLGS